MNREIKFRAWDKEYKKMMEWGKQLKGLTQNGIKTVMSYNSDDGWSDCYNLKDIDLMQYTGLKDKNGKEIYEGDIVEYDDYNGNICWNEETAMFELNYDVNIVTDFDHIYPKEVGVIGNIYENPELLEKVE